MRARNRLGRALILLGMMFLAACTTAPTARLPDRSSPTQWNFAIRGDSSLVSVTDIRDVLRQLPRIPDIDRKVAFMEVQDRNTIAVHTGAVYGPLAGGGDFLVFRRVAGAWHWDGVHGYWNA